MAEVTPGNIGFSYLDKDSTFNDRVVVDSWWRDLVNRFGICTQYYPIDYDITETHKIYGEVFDYNAIKPIKVLVEMPNEAWLFSKFGLQTDADITAIVHMGTWMNTFGHAVSSEPKVGDVIRLDNTGWANSETAIHEDTPYGEGGSICSVLNNNSTTLCEAAASAIEIAEDLTTGPNSNGNSFTANLTLTLCPSDGDWRRYPQMFQITEKRYQEISMGLNMLGGHYVWLLRGKRFEYSYETGITPENPADDNTPGGIVNDDEIVDTISDDIFDYNDSPDSNDSVYGDY